MVLLDWEEATREPWEQVGDGWEVAVLLRIDYSSASHLVLIIFCLPLIIQRAWCAARNENPESQGLHLSKKKKKRGGGQREKGKNNAIVITTSSGHDQ